MAQGTRTKDNDDDKKWLRFLELRGSIVDIRFCSYLIPLLFSPKNTQRLVLFVQSLISGVLFTISYNLNYLITPIYV